MEALCTQWGVRDARDARDARDDEGKAVWQSCRYRQHLPATSIADLYTGGPEARPPNVKAPNREPSGHSRGVVCEASPVPEVADSSRRRVAELQ